MKRLVVFAIIAFFVFSLASSINAGPFQDLQKKFNKHTWDKLDEPIKKNNEEIRRQREKLKKTLDRDPLKEGEELKRQRREKKEAERRRQEEKEAKRKRKIEAERKRKEKEEAFTPPPRPRWLPEDGGPPVKSKKEPFWRNSGPGFKGLVKDLKDFTSNVGKAISNGFRKFLNLGKNLGYEVAEDGIASFDEYLVYIVAKGDTLSIVAKKTTGSWKNWKEIENYNIKYNRRDFDTNLYVGEHVYIPNYLLK